mgnify:CR=1 FL=1
MPEIEESPLKILRRQAVQKIQDRSRRAREEESTASSASPTRALPETPEGVRGRGRRSPVTSQLSV